MRLAWSPGWRASSFSRISAKRGSSGDAAAAGRSTAAGGAATGGAVLLAQARDEVPARQIPLRGVHGAAERRARERHEPVAVDLDDVVGLRVGKQLQARAQAAHLVVVDGLHVGLVEEEHVGHRALLATLGDRTQGDAHPELLAAGSLEILLEDLLPLAAKAARAV